RAVPPAAARALAELAGVVGMAEPGARPDGDGPAPASSPPGREARPAPTNPPPSREFPPAPTNPPPRREARPASASGEGGGLRLAAYALGGGDGAVLGVATERREPGDHPVTGVAVVLLSLLTAPHRGADATVRDGALVRLLLGADPARVAGVLGSGPWIVVHASGGGTPFATATLAAALGTPLVDAGPPVRLLLPATARVTAQEGWALGVSAPVGAEELAAGDAQAGRASRRAVASRVALVRHGGEGLAALVDRAEAAAYARELLAPLSGPLAETLRVWLSLHGGWDRTAVATGLHRNTVRQRIARCAALLDRDLDDPDVRMELWFALGARREEAGEH
ncbi:MULTISPECIES: PucR family transcriptional regulator, partial [unclassified Streptomyces]|uniref:PucR family transcriptional regulator n=1 Tax=unclassified Streptomyces TaxID=2593676 RepID=UPI0016615B73